MSSASSTGPVLAARPSTGFLRGSGKYLSGALLIVTAMLLVAVLVAAANGLRIRVEKTGSMAPTLKPGDLVVVRQTPIESIRIGDVIGVRTPAGQVIVHRVKLLASEAGAISVTTQGDANPTSEQWNIHRGAEVALVRGKVPALGGIVNAVKGPWAAIVVLLAGLLLAFSQLRSIWKRS